MKSAPSFDDEIDIDLRAILQTIWKARVWIIIITIVAAFGAYAVNAWILPRKYQATSYLLIGQPVISIKQDAVLTYTPRLPDIKTVAKLAPAPELLKKTIDDPELVASLGKTAFSVSELAGKVKVIDIGKDQISIQVTDTDPQRVVLLANTLAKIVTEKLNSTYGLSTVAQTLESQVLQSHEEYEQAQAALELAISKSRIDALSAQRDRMSADLADVLNSISRTTRGLDDLVFIEDGFSGVPGDTPLSLGDGLALTTLRQRSLTTGSDIITTLRQLPSSSGSDTINTQNILDTTTITPSNDPINLQVNGSTFDGYTVADALETTAQMRISLQAQLKHLHNEQDRLEGEIPQLQSDLANAQAELDQLATQRDQSGRLYDTLFQQRQQIETVLNQSANIATVSIQAVRPDGSASPRVIQNTFIAGVGGFFLALFGVIVWDWLRSGGLKTKSG